MGEGVGIQSAKIGASTLETGKTDLKARRAGWCHWVLQLPCTHPHAARPSAPSGANSAAWQACGWPPVASDLGAPPLLLLRARMSHSLMVVSVEAVANTCRKQEGGAEHG